MSEKKSRTTHIYYLTTLAKVILAKSSEGVMMWQVLLNQCRWNSSNKSDWHEDDKGRSSQKSACFRDRSPQNSEK